MNLQISCQHIAGRVSYFLSNWEVLTQDQWVLQTVGGYQLELTSTPHQTRVPHQIRCSPENMAQISTEVTDLINKGAIIETQVVQQSFVSQIFLVEKKDGGQRPVVNLKCLNQYLKTEHFKMEGLHLLPGLLQAQDWMVKLDLKDAYLQVPIHPNHQHLLTYVPVGRKELHVQMPTIWPVLSTQSVHQIAEASGGLLEANRLSSNNISGQHANLAPEQEATTPDHPVDLPVAQGPRTYGQPEKVHNKPHSRVGVSGLSGGICINKSVHSPRETAEDKARCKANVGLPMGDSEGSGTVCRESCSYTESHPFSSITLSSSPNVNEFCPSPELHTGGGEQEIRHSSDTDRAACKADLTWWVSLEQSHLGTPVCPPCPTVMVHSDASNKGWGQFSMGKRRQEVSGHQKKQLTI